MRKILGYILALVGLLTTSFFRNYHSHVIPFPILWILLGIGLSVGGTYLVVSVPRKKAQAALTENNKKIDQLKLTGKRVSVDLLKCEFKSGYSIQTEKEYDDTIVLLAGRLPGVIDRATSNDDEPPVGSEIKKSVIVFPTQWNGENVKFVSQQISKDETTLEFLCGMRKNTTLYVDVNDSRNYWFDLEFLKD